MQRERNMSQTVPTVWSNHSDGNYLGCVRRTGEHHIVQFFRRSIIKTNGVSVHWLAVFSLFALQKWRGNMFNISMYYKINFGLITDKDILCERMSLKTSLRGGGFHVNSDLSSCKYTIAKGNRQDLHSLPNHAHFSSIIASCSQWWDRSSQSQSWCSPMAHISRLLVDLSLSLSLLLY